MIRASHFTAAPLALAGVVALATLFAAAPSRAADLTLSFEGIKSPTGAVMVAVFDAEAAYEAGGAPIAASIMPVTGARAGAVLSGLKPGRYAVKAFHDVDGDGKMGANPFGMPLEPFAFSNNAKAAMGPAKWGAAAFDVVETGASQTIAID